MTFSDVLVCDKHTENKFKANIEHAAETVFILLHLKETENVFLQEGASKNSTKRTEFQTQLKSFGDITEHEAGNQWTMSACNYQYHTQHWICSSPPGWPGLLRGTSWLWLCLVVLNCCRKHQHRPFWHHLPGKRMSHSDSFPPWQQ